MKVIIIGGGLTGLYIGYMLKKINVDFDLYEKSSKPGGRINTVKVFDTYIDCGANIILPQHLHMIGLLNKLGIELKYTKISTNSLYEQDKEQFHLYLNKIKSIYEKTKPINISAIIFIRSILKNEEWTLFKNHMTNINILQSEISNFMKYNFYDLYQNTDYVIQTVNSTQTLTDKLALLIQDHLYLGHRVQEITYQPLTNKYLLMVNDNYINADKVIIATNSKGCRENIRFNIPKEIYSQFDYIKSFNHLKLFTYHTSSINTSNIISPNSLLQTQSIISNISVSEVNNKMLTMDYIIGTKADILYDLIKKDSDSDKIKVITILNRLLKNITNIDFPPIKDYAFCYWSNGYHVNIRQIKTDFYRSHGLILAGEWVHPYHNTLEGSCMSAIETVKIINKYLFMDKLSRNKLKI